MLWDKLLVKELESERIVDLDSKGGGGVGLCIKKPPEETDGISESVSLVQRD